MTRSARRRVTTTEIKAAMAATWKSPNHSLLWEVGDGTGSDQTRRADAVIMSLWPSRGLELHGVEIKVSRSDWKRELANASKAEAVSKYCHRWWIHAGPDIVIEGELPDGWGLRTYDGSKWDEKVEARLREPQPISHRFLAALLRREDKDLEFRAGLLADGRIAAAIAGLDARVVAEVDRQTGSAAMMAAYSKTIEEETGLSIGDFTRSADAMAAARMTAAIMKTGLADQYRGLDTALCLLRNTGDQINQVMKMLEIPSMLSKT